jgi:hypothetical protein
LAGERISDSASSNPAWVSLIFSQILYLCNLRNPWLTVSVFGLSVQSEDASHPDPFEANGMPSTYDSIH